jgi:hypothetical protein
VTGRRLLHFQVFPQEITSASLACEIGNEQTIAQRQLSGFHLDSQAFQPFVPFGVIGFERRAAKEIADRAGLVTLVTIIGHDDPYECPVGFLPSSPAAGARLGWSARFPGAARRVPRTLRGRVAAKRRGRVGRDGGERLRSDPISLDLEASSDLRAGVESLWTKTGCYAFGVQRKQLRPSRQSVDVRQRVDFESCDSELGFAPSVEQSEKPHAFSGALPLNPVGELKHLGASKLSFATGAIHRSRRNLGAYPTTCAAIAIRIAATTSAAKCTLFRAANIAIDGKPLTTLFVRHARRLVILGIHCQACRFYAERALSELTGRVYTPALLHTVQTASKGGIC